MCNIVLNDDLSIRSYFEKVLELVESGEDFPVNLDVIPVLVNGQLMQYRSIYLVGISDKSLSIDHIFTTSIIPYMFIVFEIREQPSSYRS